MKPIFLDTTISTELQNIVNYIAGFPLQNGVVIAGGAMRDLYLGATRRDIDLYVSVQDYERVYCILTGKTEGKNDWSHVSEMHEMHERGSEEYDHQYIQMQREFETAEFGLVNLIGLRWDDDCMVDVDVQSVIRRFNIGINSIGIDINGIDWTDAFEKDYRHRTATVVRNGWGFEGTERAIRKLETKYPDLRAVFEDGSPWSRREAEYRATGQTSMDI